MSTLLALTTLAKTHMILARKFLSQTLRVTLKVTQKTAF